MRAGRQEQASGPCRCRHSRPCGIYKTGGGGKPPPYGCAGPKRAVRRRTLQSISAAWHRRRPGGPGRYSAAAARACRVIDAGNPRRGSACDGHKKEPGVDARPVLALSVQLSAAMNPRTGGGQGGRSPPALLSPHFFGKKWGRPPRRHPPGGWASTRRADTIRPYGLGSWRTALVRPAPRGRARFRTKKRAARDTGGACVYRSSRKYAKPRLAGGCLSRLLRREVKISTTTVTT